MGEIFTLPAIVFICYFVGLCVKTFTASEKVDRLIPVICGITGAVLGVAVFFTAPALIVADTWLQALAVGISSGLAATGANQIYKQMTK